MSHNTFTYRHFDLPALRPEIKAEIIALDCQIADLILKGQGNYRELEELAEMLDDALNSCELNLKSIRIIADNNDPIDTSELCSLKDLSLEHKKLVYWLSKTNSTLFKLLSDITGKTPESIADKVGNMNSAICANDRPSESELEKVIDSLTSIGTNSNLYFQDI